MAFTRSCIPGTVHRAFDAAVVGADTGAAGRAAVGCGGVVVVVDVPGNDVACRAAEGHRGVAEETCSSTCT